jgi:transformation/transcription domain-associated protein
LRTSKEDFTLHHRQQLAAAHASARRAAEARRVAQLRAQQQQQQLQQQQPPSASSIAPASAGNDGQNEVSALAKSGVKDESSEIKVVAPRTTAQPPSGSRAPTSAPTDQAPTAEGLNTSESRSSVAPGASNGPDGQAGSQNGSQPPSASVQAAANIQNAAQMAAAMSRQPQELLEEILNILKTAFPLLALSMEKMVDHINVRAKPPIEEDIYRFLSALLNDAISQWSNKTRVRDDNDPMPQQVREKIRIFCAQTKHDLRQMMHDQFVAQPITLREYILRLQRWHERYEKALDARPKREQLDHGDCLLSDFHHSKFDDVEVPGQYMEHVDSNNAFAKISRFAPTLEVARGFGFFFRRLTMIGTNGTSYIFAVQSPSGRHCRREERLTQLFRIMNTVLQKRKESRKRNLSIHLPAAIPLAPALRLVTNDSSYLTLQDVFDDHCRRMDMWRDKPMLEFIDKWRQIYVPTNVSNDRSHSLA